MSASLTRKINQFLYLIRTSSTAVFHYDHELHNIAVWHWPANSQGERVTPSDLETYRLSHVKLGPCCLCPLQHQDVGNFKESAIFMAGHGRYAGEYIAACADNRCNYFVLLERLHSKVGLRIRQYPLRALDNPAPPPVRTLLDENPEVGAMLRRITRHPNRTVLPVIRTCAAPARSPAEVFELVLRLDSGFNAGLTAEELQELLVKCDNCGLIMTHRVFQSHNCIMPRVGGNDEVIDLTIESD